MGMGMGMGFSTLVIIAQQGLSMECVIQDHHYDCVARDCESVEFQKQSYVSPDRHYGGIDLLPLLVPIVLECGRPILHHSCWLVGWLVG